MSQHDEVDYRLRPIEGYVEEAREDAALRRWRSCVDNSQLAAENATKAILARVGPVGRTHHPATLLMTAVGEQRYPSALTAQLQRLAECARALGTQVHNESAYGNELARRTPWEIFGEAEARRALGLAEEALALAKQIVEGGLQQ